MGSQRVRHDLATEYTNISIVLFLSLYFLTPEIFCIRVQPINNAAVVSGEQ